MAMKAVRRSAVPVAIAVGGLLLFTACDVDEASYTGYSGGQTVAIIGDNQTTTVQADLHSAMDPYYQSRNISHEGATVASMQSAADTLAATNPQAVVIDLGTNDANSGVPAATTEAQLNTMIAKFPSSCVVVVNLNEQSAAPTYSVSTAQAVNVGVASSTALVADWNGTLSGNLAAYTASPANLIPAGSGKAALASTISTALSRCFVSGG
jgi:hypothetical protein